MVCVPVHRVTKSESFPSSLTLQIRWVQTSLLTQVKLRGQKSYTAYWKLGTVHTEILHAVFQETFRQLGRQPRGGWNFSLRHDFWEGCSVFSPCILWLFERPEVKHPSWTVALETIPVMLKLWLCWLGVPRQQGCSTLLQQSASLLWDFWCWAPCLLCQRKAVLWIMMLP